MNFAGVRAVGDVFRAELDGLGFTVRWVDGAAFKRAGHLVAERAGRGPRVLLIGHLDTVFEPDSPFQRFERIDEKTARGPGIIDMKGGDVVMISALKALNAAGALDALHVTVVMTGDEELTGEPLGGARAALVDAAKGADIAIGFEDGPGDPQTAVIARRGTTGWLLRVKAKPAHSSQIFREDIGSGAIYEAARILRLPRDARRRAASHLQSRRDPRRHGRRSRPRAGPRHRLGQGERHRRAGDRDGRPADAVGRAVRQRQGAHARDRRDVPAARRVHADVRRRLSAARAEPGQRAPARALRPGQPRRRRRPGRPPSIPIAPAPPTSRSPPATSR